MQGHVSITIRNPDGSIAAKAGGRNMITDAIRRLLNPPALMLRNSDTSYISSYFGRFMPIGEQCFKGITLWPEPLPEEPDCLVPPDPLAEVGHAGRGYAGESVKRGSYNSIESGAVEGGYKHVWDFNSNQANGTIRALAATLEAGGNRGWAPDIVNDEGEFISCVGSLAAIDYGRSVLRYSTCSSLIFPGITNPTSSAIVCIGFRKEEGQLVFYYGTRSYSSVTITKVAVRDDATIALMQPANVDFMNASDVAHFENHSFTLEIAPNFPQAWFMTDSEILIPTWVSSSSYHLCRIDIATMEITAQVTISVPQGGTFGSSSSYTSHFVAGGYLYISNANASGWQNGAYKINLDNLGDIQHVDIRTYNTSLNSTVPLLTTMVLPNGIFVVNYGSGDGYLTGRLVHGDGQALCRFPRAISSTTSGVTRCFTDKDTLPFLYVNYYSSVSNNYNMLTPLLYYLVPVFTSIYNLPTPITKSPGQTMKIEYTFLEGEEGGGA